MNDDSSSINRRGALKQMSAVSFGGVGTSLASSSATAQAVDPGEVDVYDTFSGVGDVLQYANDFEAQACGSIQLVDILKSGDKELNRLSGSLFGWSINPGQDLDDWMWEHGTIIDVENGSLYSNQDPEALGHYPQRDGDGDFNTDDGVDLAYTAAKAAIGVASSNPYVNAALGAESIVSSLVTDSSSSNELGNSQEYRYEYCGWGTDPAKGGEVSHTFDFFIQTDIGYQVEFDLKQWFRTDDNCGENWDRISGGAGNPIHQEKLTVNGLPDQGGDVFPSSVEREEEKIPDDVVENNEILRQFANEGNGHVYRVSSPEAEVNTMTD